MKNSRRLELRREALTELTAAELTLAGAGLDGPPLTINATCSGDDVMTWVREVTLDLSVHWHCSWSCI